MTTDRRAVELEAKYQATQIELERRVAEQTERLRQSEEKFSKAFRASPAAISIASLPDGRWIDVNDTFVKMTGYSREEAIGRTSAELGLVDADERAKILDVIREKGLVRDVEIQMRNKSQALVDVLVSVEEIEINGQPCVLTIQYDITAFKHAEREVLRLNADLEQRQAALEAINKELEAFSYSIAHDLRAPLRIIDGYHQLLVESSADQLDEKGKSYLQHIFAASQQMGHLIDDLLNLSQVNRHEMTKIKVNLSQIAERIVADLRTNQPERVVEVVIQDHLTASADRSLIRVLLVNLLENAWKFTRKQSSARIEFGMSHNGDQQIFFVRDNGVGFDMAYANKLFGAFQRLHSVTEFEGTGVGLATVQRVVHRHGGRIWAEGAVNEGATFYFTLPYHGKDDGSHT